MMYADNRCTYTETYDKGNHLYHFTGPCVVTKKTVTVKVRIFRMPSPRFPPMNVSS